jgi:2-polyprenyl-3-methyl-5-hydroxy-6-metoxy-1,4-benzoquinol methylase
MPAAEPLIDVRHLLKTYTVEQLNQTANDFFLQFVQPEQVAWLAAKPFANFDDTPQLLISLGCLLEGLHLARGMSVLDFGAGPCWIARYLAQMGFEVTAADVSPQALSVGRKGLELYPIHVKHTPPKFLLFDGHKLDVPDGSFDRILCFDAFHHVPNQEETLAELARVLKVGGVAGFSEPGPTHSRSERSQRVMRRLTVIENDIVLEEIWELARKVGFSDLRLGYFTPHITLMTMPEYYGHVHDGQPMKPHYDQYLRELLKLRRMFFLYRYPPGVRSSQSGEGLRGELRVEVPAGGVPAGTPIEVTVRARNTGEAAWMQASYPMGRVNVGVRKVTGVWSKAKQDLLRIPFPPSACCAVFPGEEAVTRGALPPLPRGRHQLEFDLVCEGVAWFQDVGGQPLTVTVQSV